MSEMLKNIKGTKDILPPNAYNLKLTENYIHSFLQSYGYEEIRTPIFEATNLFKSSIGGDTDIVTKEMYSWIDQGNTELTLRPELTASVIRAFNQYQLGSKSPITRLYYLGKSFRRERPQKGRLRQFSQFGVETIGSHYPEQDVEVISIAYNIYKSLGIKDINVKINSIGSPEIRKIYLKDLRCSLNDYKNDLSAIDQNRLQNNALRLFDSKDPNCQKIINENAPFIFDYLSSEDLDHFNQIIDYLGKMDIQYKHDKTLVRGLDYYTHTTFEINSLKLGAQDALCGGGRYNKLIQHLGGKDAPSIGFAAGIERLLIALEKNTEIQPLDLYMILLGDKSLNAGLIISNRLRTNSFSIVIETLRRSMKAQMREANKLNAKFVLIIGENEVIKNKAIIKNMVSSEQIEVSFDDISHSSFSSSSK